VCVCVCVCVVVSPEHVSVHAHFSDPCTYAQDVISTSTDVNACKYASNHGVLTCSKGGLECVTVDVDVCRYGVKPMYFDILGQALLWTLEEALEDLWTPEVRVGLLCECMWV
jgi:hypothetical protein